MGKTLALVNGKIYVNKGVFAEAVAMQDGNVIKVGKKDDVLRFIPKDSDIIDLGGKVVIPGLNDSHLHIFLKGMEMFRPDIASADSIDSLIDICKKFMADHPEKCKNGLLGAGWNQDKFTSGEKRMPTRHDLDKISTEVPIVLARVCVHVVTANTKAIEMLGLGKNPKQPTNGTILLEDDGYPSGIFTEAYGESVQELIPEGTIEDQINAFLAAQKYAISRGVTSIQSNDVGQCGYSMEEVFGMLHKIYSDGNGIIRYRHQVCVKDINELKHYIDTEYKKPYPDKNKLDLGPLKLFKDGSLGGRTALMRHEYLDDPGNFGVETINDKDFDEICQVASDAGMQIITHTIGDSALEKVINSYSKLGANNRNGIVHCQISDMSLLNRIKGNDFLILYQPIFLDYDMHVVESRCGKELSLTSYAFKTALDLGIHVSYGTDSPVEDLDPFANIYSAVTRLDKSGYPDGGFNPKEKVSVEDAIDCYTVGSAYNEFKENIKGRIAPGYLADMVVLDKDIFTINPEEIININPVMTIIGGEIVYRC